MKMFVIIRTSYSLMVPFSIISLMTSSSLLVPNSFSSVRLDAPSKPPWVPCLMDVLSVRDLCSKGCICLVLAWCCCLSGTGGEVRGMAEDGGLLLTCW